MDARGNCRAWVTLVVGQCGGAAGLLLWGVCLLVHGAASCEDRDVKRAQLKCGPLLAEVSTSILHSSTATANYSSVCREFAEYVKCTEPKVQGCEATVLIANYLDSKKLYTDSPFYCHLPTLEPTIADDQQQSSLSSSIGCDVNVLQMLAVVLLTASDTNHS